MVRFGDACFKHRGLLLPVAVVLLLIPSPPLASSAIGTSLIGLALALVGLAIRVSNVGLVYIIRGGKDHRVYAEELVTQGLYSHVRNPMYVGNAFLLAGLAVASNSLLFAVAGVPIAVGLHVGIIAAEEHFLRTKFGAQYDAYCARVPRIVPRLTGLTTSLAGASFNWSRVLEKEFMEPVDWLSATALISMVALWRSGQIAGNLGIVALMAVVVVVRLVLWTMSRSVRRRAPRPGNSTP